MRSRHRLLIILVLTAVGVTVLGACSRGGDSELEAATDGEVQALGTGEDGRDASNADPATVPSPTVGSATGAPEETTDGVFLDSAIPAEAFDNKPADTDGARELPARIEGYNYVDRDVGDQFSQQAPELAGVEVTLRSLDPVPRTGAGYRPQIIVMKSPEATTQFRQGVWQAQEKTLAGQTVWVIGGADATTQVAWVKNDDTVIILSMAPYSVLEPIMIDLITHAP